MTSKLEQAARQALTALENFDYWLKRNTYCIAGTGYEEAITALRSALADSAASSSEALAEPHKENCACEVCRGCDNADIKAKQAEQEPVAFKVHHGEVCYKSNEDDQSYGMWCPVSLDYKAPFPEGTNFYAAPVRTKDLTDSEIADIGTNCGTSMWSLMFARAVIAAYKEKNK